MSDPGLETIQAVADQLPAHGTLRNSNGSFTYTPAQNYSGADTFTFHGYDGLNGGNVANVSLLSADVTPPVVTNPGSQLNTEGDSVNLPDHQAIDPNGTGRDLSARLDCLPVWESARPAA